MSGSVKGDLTSRQVASEWELYFILQGGGATGRQRLAQELQYIHVFKAKDRYHAPVLQPFSMKELKGQLGASQSQIGGIMTALGKRITALARLVNGLVGQVNGMIPAFQGIRNL